tara:strand:+ start:10839 stop:11405 length:567 start_codon:yes stop_codon:yes gene_type:complete
MKILLMILFLPIFFSCGSKTILEPKASIYDIALNSIEGTPIDFTDFKGKKILFVNVASKCGFTSQYEDLQELYNTYQENLMIIGLPCNQFGSQEAGSNEEIKTFCQINYGVTFLITEKINVKEEKQHPLYAWLTQKECNGNSNTTVKWNFQKYLVDEEGRFVDYYYSATNPLSTKITKHLTKQPIEKR